MDFLNMGKYHNWNEKFCGGTNNTKMQKIILVNLKSEVTIQIKAKNLKKNIQWPIGCYQILQYMCNSTCRRRRKRVEARKKYSLKFDKNHKLEVPRSSTNIKSEKHKEIHFKLHYNQINWKPGIKRPL